MALDKDGVTGTMNRYANALSKAARDCEDAANRVRNTQSEVADNWKGNSGEAMAQALATLQQEISALSNEISQLQVQVNSRKNQITSNWAD